MNDHMTDPDKLTVDEFYKIAFSRNIGIMNDDDQQRLRNSRVAIAGLGGAGSPSVACLPRLGIGKFTIADFDTFGVENFNRQLSANIHTVGKPKVDVSRDIILSINPHADISVFPEGISEENLDDFLKDVDCVVDALDFFSMDIRRLLYKKAREHGIYILSAGPIGFGSLVYVVDPNGVSFDEFFCINDKLTNEEMAVHLAIGMLPDMLQDPYFSLKNVKFKGHKAPSLVSGSLATGNLITTEVSKILLKKNIRPLPYVSQFDPYVQKYSFRKLTRGNRRLWQRLKLYMVKKKMSKQ